MNEVLKKIGTYEITEQDIDAFIQALPREQQMYASVPQFREQVLERLTEVSLFAMLGEERKKDETDFFKQAMANTRRDLLGRMALQEMMEGITVTEEEVKEYFETHKARFVKDASANASHILVPEENLANSIKAEIESGEISFEEAAKKYSTCPSKEQGGNLGDFGPGQMVAEFNDAVFTGELGKIIGPVQTQFGYHLILINSRREAVAPEFEAVAKQAEQMLLGSKQEKAYGEKIMELKEKYIG